MLTDNQKILLFYALEAVERTLRQDAEGEIYTIQSEYYLQLNEMEKLGSFTQLQKLIEQTLDDLC